MKIKMTIGFFVALSAALFLHTDAFAADVDTVITNVQQSSVGLSGLMSAFAYLTGLLFAVLGVMKTIDHVSTPTQTHIREPIIRFIIGGSMFALPIVLETVYHAINGTGASTLDLAGSGTGLSVITAFATASGLWVNFNSLLINITGSTSLIPGFIAMTAYMLGILLVMSGLLKARDHVDDPTRTTIREPVIRLLIAGALFGLPTVYTAMYQTIADGGFGGLGAAMTMLSSVLNIFGSSDNTIGLFGFAVAGVGCNPIAALAGSTLGDAICTLQISTIGIPTFLAALSYVLGLVFGFWGLFKIRDHVLEPSRTSMSEGVTRLLAGGAFFAMPFVAYVLTNSVVTVPLMAFQVGVGTNTGFAGLPTVCSVGAIIGLPLPGSTNSLDEAFVCLMANVMGPIQSFLNFFCLAAGMILIMIGISRIIRSAQEGARGPGGRGTIATFIAGAVLISANAIVRAASASIFVNPITRTNASLAYSTGMTLAEQNATLNVISAVLKFMLIIGLISFVRGIFIMRDAAEGNQQASVMSGITHIIGGALAVNLGPLLNAVQNTLGVTAFGVSFA